jgi:hypothetical protein
MKATVVDMNVVRREEKILPVLEAAAREKIPVLLPEALLYEGVKGRDWEEGLRMTLGHVARFSPRVVALARRVRHLTDFERRTGTAIVDLAYREQQPRLLALLADVRSGSRTAFDEVRRENPMAPPTVTKDDDGESRNLVMADIDRLQRRLPPDLLKHLRQHPGDDVPAILLADPDRGVEFQTILQRGGYDEQIAEALALVPSITANQYLGRFALALRWISYGGARTANPSQFSNDLRDLEYLILGLGCTGFETNDSGLRCLHRQLSIAAKLRWARSIDKIGRRFPAVPPFGIYRTTDHPVD